MKLILVRHGDAHAGFNGAIAGPIGCRGLTDLGRRQAELLRIHLTKPGAPTADHIVTSELPRAIETAEIIAPALGFDHVPQDCDLCEMHTGEADGVDWLEYGPRFGSFDMAAEPDRVFAPGGDSWNSFHQRVEQVMDRLAVEYEDQTVVAVCHAGVITASLAVRLGTAPTAARLIPTNTGLTGWEFDPTNQQWTLRYYNSTGHLASTVPQPATPTPKEEQA